MQFHLLQEVTGLEVANTVKETDLVVNDGQSLVLSDMSVISIDSATHGLVSVQPLVRERAAG